MDTLDKKLHFEFRTSQQILKLISEIDFFKGKWKVLEDQTITVLEELKNIATIQSIGSSTRIEGATLSDDKVKQLISDLKINKLENRDEQEVIGYYDVLELIIENSKDIDLSENYIMQLHSVMLKYSTKDRGQKGAYKKVSNKVVANYPDGTQKTIFNTTEPYLVQSEMHELINWTSRNFKSQEYHPLLVLGLFIYEFLSIHPFHDGNGRLSRLLTTLLLIKMDYDFVKYISFEHLIENRKEQYYAALMECQKNRNTKDEQLDKWMLFFLNSLKLLTIKLNIKLSSTKIKQIYLNERQQKIKTYILENQPCKIGDINKHFSEISINTLKKDLQYLVKNKMINKQGERKATIYFAS
ncbi:MAG: Fic family protein [candidate division KSB1 bacterium]|nr:Fic family protein [candidate division KSB1 bacterium]